MQEDGLTNEGRYHLLLLYKQAHDKRDQAESLNVYISREEAKTDTCTHAHTHTHLPNERELAHRLNCGSDCSSDYCGSDCGSDCGSNRVSDGGSDGGSDG